MLIKNWEDSLNLEKVANIIYFEFRGQELQLYVGYPYTFEVNL